ncbi:MAG: energy-coupling factor transporter transmembrane protein EcfT [Chloroflexi bacterium]|nr:energy-coupling factor transporter transmembrane protein EcfT [Chloroflexota bacterium]
MEDFELLRYVTIGQYFPTGSPIHRLDPRVKIIGLIALAMAIVAQTSAVGSIAGVIVALALIAFARVDVRFALRGLAPSIPILALLAILQLGFGWGARASGCIALWSWEIVNVTTCSIEAVIVLLARLVALVVLTSLLTFTSTLSELSRGIEALLRPFQRVGVPGDELAMVFTIALRFVPTLALETEKLLKAQAARGANIQGGSNPIARARQLLPVLVPLFINTLRRSEDLAAAMEARGYSGGAGRTHYVRLHFRRADLIALVIVIALAAGLLVVR